MSHYDALGVARDASAAEVRRAYLALARRHHPDFHVDADEATRTGHARQMQLVNEAWGVLGDTGLRARYDLSLRQPHEPPTERLRPNRDPVVPAGKGWTPRSGDDRWQRDYRGWADETDDLLAPDVAGPARSRGIVVLIPVGLFALAVVSLFLGVVLEARPLVAVGFVAVALSAILFVMLPVLEMARGRGRD